MTKTTTSAALKGFAAMDPALQREIASKGGKAVPAEERSFSKSGVLASEAGRKGGLKSSESKRAKRVLP